MTATLVAQPLQDRSLEVLRRAGNPFRNYFARNPDDEVCARYHVPSCSPASASSCWASSICTATTRDALGSRADPGQQGGGQDAPAALDQAWPATAAGSCWSRRAPTRKTAISSNTCSSRSSTRCSAAASKRALGRSNSSARSWCRRLLQRALQALTPEERLDLFPPPGLGRWARTPRPGQRAGPGTHAMADRQPGPAMTPRARFAPLRQTLRRMRPRPAQGPASWSASHIERTRGAQHRRPDAPAHLPGLGPGRACSATRATWPTSSPTASPSWTSRSGRAGRTWCWPCSRC